MKLNIQQISYIALTHGCPAANTCMSYFKKQIKNIFKL